MALLRPIPAAWRDTILFLGGLAGLFNEAFIRTGPERYGLLVVYTGMLGLPVVLRGEDRAISPPTPPTPPSPASSGPPSPTGGTTQ